MDQRSLVWQLRGFQLALQSALDEALRHAGLTTAQLSVLEALMDAPGSSSADLARECGVTAQTMNGIVLTLATNGLLVREPHRVHGRILRTYLSNAGEAKLEAGRRVVAGVEEQMVATLSDDEIASLKHSIDVCGGALSALSRRNGRRHEKVFTSVGGLIVRAHPGGASHHGQLQGALALEIEIADVER